MNLVHIIPNLGPGGPTRSLTSFVEWSRRNTPRLSHHIVTLEPRVYPLLSIRLRRLGASIHQNLDVADLDKMLADADVVLVHFWNMPLVWRLLGRRTPPVRLVIWSLVRGDHPPQQLNADFLHSAAGLVLTAAAPPRLLPALARAPIVPGFVQVDRVTSVVRRAHENFHVDYIGTTNSGKLDIQIFSIASRLTIPNVKVRIYGGALEPAMAHAHATMQDPSRVEVLGFTENIADVFATTDVFAFPMAETSYGNSDLALQEAMLAGLPIVVSGGQGSSRLVENEKTGLVVSGAEAFTAAIERLYRDPELRRALGATAKAHATVEFSVDKNAARLTGVIENVARAERRPLFVQRAGATDLGLLTPAALFLVSQGWPENEAADAVTSWVANGDERLSKFAETASDVCYKVEGGIIQWRNHEPNDPLLRAWCGCWLRRLGDYQGAATEFDAALRLGAHAGAVAQLAAR